MESTKIQADSDHRRPVPEIEAELRVTLPWLFYPAFSIGPNEGFDGRCFGSRAGPARSVYNVLHEVSHAVEMTLLPSRIWKRRVQRSDFEMRIRTHLEIAGQRYYEPVTMQATERECRTGGIQLRLLEAGGYATDGFLQKYALTLRFMADWIHGGYCPSQPSAPERFNERERQWVNTRIDLIQQAYEQFPLPDIQDRWSSVMSWLAKKQMPEAA
jgi:hypothetical protein